MAYVLILVFCPREKHLEFLSNDLQDTPEI